MPNVLVNKAYELKAETRAAVEAELERELADDEDVTIMAFAMHEAPQGKARRRAVEKLKAHFKRIDRRKRKATGKEIESVLQEAIRTARPSYRERE